MPKAPASSFLLVAAMSLASASGSTDARPVAVIAPQATIGRASQGAIVRVPHAPIERDPQRAIVRVPHAPTDRGPRPTDAAPQPVVAPSPTQRPTSAEPHPLPPPGPAVRDEVLQSAALGRPLKYRVLLPADYDASRRRYPSLYLLHGLTGAYDDWEGRTHLARHARPYSLIVVMPDGGNLWYTDSSTSDTDKIETAIGMELVNEVDRRFRTIDAPYARAIAGLSMGGYGALKFALKRTSRFAFAASLSGALHAARDPDFMKNVARTFPDVKITEDFERVFGPAGGPHRAANDVFALAAKADPARVPYLYLDCGTGDGLLNVNREMAALLQKQKIRYEYHEVPGGHTWDYWDRRIRHVLEALAAHVPYARHVP